MIDAKMITILFDILALAFILSGFLLGLKRGLKGSVNRLLLVLISAILAILLTKAFSGTLMNIKLSFFRDSHGQTTSANGYIEDMLQHYKLTDTITLASFTLTISAVITIVKLISNTFVFLIFFEFIRFITWIVYMIFFRTKKSAIVQAEASGNPIKMRRWWGSLVGAFQGLFVFVFLLIPISGVSSIIYDMSNTASAAEEKNGAGIIETYVPSQYQNYVNVYENSIFNKAFGWTKIDELIFNTLTTAKIDGIEMSLRNEAVNANEIFKVLNKYELIDTVKNKTYKEKLDSLNDEQIETMLADIFDKTSSFTILKCVLIDSANIVADEVGVDEKLSASNIDWKKEGEIFSRAMTNIVCASRPIVASVLEDGSSGLTDEILTDEKVDYARFGKGFDILSQMQLVSKSYKQTVKKILSLDKVKEFGDRYGIDLSTINVDNVSFEKTFNSVGGLLRTAVKLKNSATIENLATEDLAEVLESIKDLDDSIKEGLNDVLVQTFEEQFNVDVPENFNLFEDEELLDATVGTIASLGSVEIETALSSQQAEDVLTNIENVLDSDNAQVILDVVAKSTGAEGPLPQVSEAKDAVSHLNTFVTASDDDPNLETYTINLVNALNAQPNLITVLKFKSNTYAISTIKYNILADTPGVTTNNIMSLFTVAVD